MMERRKLVKMWQGGNAAALATLVRIEGSSYRATGARLLVARDGSYVGSVSGGCLEAEIVRKAQWMVRSGAALQRYSTLFDDTAEIPYGLGCGGTVDVLVEPAGTPEFVALMEAMQASLRGHTCHLTTRFDPAGGRLWRRVQAAAGEILFASGQPEKAAELAFEETFAPPQRLLVFGAGDDADPLVRMAALLGWTVVVIDSRAQWARAERFPEAAEVLAADQVDALSVSASDAVVLMTHSYEQDRRWLEQVLPLTPRYLGLLGSRHRSALLVAEAAAALGWELDRACTGLYSPVGLDIGGDGAEAVALSVLAEVQGCVHGKLGTPRRMTPESVRAQIERGGASRYLQAQCAL